jgi:membrane-bound lytic murein transglycosylase B
MRDWSVSGSDEGGPAHASASPWFARIPSLVAAVAVPALMVAAFLAPQHGTVRHHAGGARPAAAVPHPSQPDIVVADSVTSAAGSATPTAAATSPAAPPSRRPGSAAPAAISALAADGIPRTALDAYENAAKRAGAQYPNCHLPWPLLAGIGRVESDHGRFAGAVLYSDGTSSHPILGIPLDGSRSATITDTDRGALDGDKVYDRAVGPMQFIPSTWSA